MTRRRCAEFGCGAYLSRYNPKPYCAPHLARRDVAEQARQASLSAGLGSRAREIEAMILAAPSPITARQIADALGMTPQGVGYHLRDMVAAGVIARQRVSRRPRGCQMVYAPGRPFSDLLAA